jgi:hypothetical protein
LRVKGRFLPKTEQKELLRNVLGDGELLPKDLKQFNSNLTQLVIVH